MPEAPGAEQIDIFFAKSLEIARQRGFPSGNVDETVYSNGAGELWAAFTNLEAAAVPRRWNAFGVYDPKRQAQMITVEVNTPTNSSSAQVAGFFAKDAASGEIYLMHDGSVGGGKGRRVNGLFGGSMRARCGGQHQAL
ncbi:hypothetical protein [Asticcacaulis sp. YBE204]|uniref:hypothetical protein n=1 Tax=Asticcacaulis sp. YBE204 TaxID=1282363 RepID=UPI0003C3F6C0|nr:hypothetical protein [Asticcacaulis sp. YBE204]ESQ79340.1 hypothetical protein AEYBE204_10045 [Asticcacaulis sp. YBE204]